MPQSGHATVDFTVARGAATAGDLTVRVTGLPGGVSAADVSVASAATKGTLTFAASTTAVLGTIASVAVELRTASATLASVPFTVKVSGAPGTLDTTFGGDGHIVLRLPDPVVPATSGNGLARAVAQYPATAGAHAGKVVVAVQLDTTGTASDTRKLAVVRFNADGSKDASFGGGNGYALLDGSPSPLLVPVAIAIDSRGRIVVYGLRVLTNTVCDNLVARFTDAGVIDPGFTQYDENPPGGFCGTPLTLRVLDGDKLLLQGVWNNFGGPQLPLLVQLNNDGTRDATAFAGSYAIRMPNPDTSKPVFSAPTMLVDGAGNYVIAGRRCEGGFNAAYTACESAVGRITAAGAWDTSFGSAGTGGLGYSALSFGTTQTPALAQGFSAVARDASGNLVAVGNNEGLTTGTIARFLGTTGALDMSFGASGRVTPVLVTGATSQQLDDVVLDEDGRLVAVGYADSGGPLVVVTRYTAAGAIDASYGTAGVGSTSAAGQTPKALLQPDGRLIVVGAMLRAGGGSDAVAWRFWP